MSLLTSLKPLFECERRKKRNNAGQKCVAFVGRDTCILMKDLMGA